MSKLDRVFEEYGLCAKKINANKILDSFIQEMSLGLSKKKSSLAMLNSYIKPSLDWKNETVAVIDAGGTNLRIGLATINHNGNIDLHNFTKIDMPGRKKEIEPNEFYDLISEKLYDFKNDFAKIGFCFSYPTEIFPDKDGRLMYWTKEIKIPKMTGQFIGANLSNSLLRNNFNEKKITILNDTVATLLSGYTIGVKKNISQYIGFILGTGTNSSCIINDYIYNVESGGFSNFPFSEIDNLVDSSSENPGAYRFEKAISGAYLGTITLKFMQKISRDDFFSESASSLISSLQSIETAYFSELYNNDINANNIFYSSDFSNQDRDIINIIFGKIVERAALFSAINIAATIIKSNQNMNKKFLISADGSTLYKTPNFLKYIEINLLNLLEDKNISYEIIKVDNSPLIGAAVAAIS